MGNEPKNAEPSEGSNSSEDLSEYLQVYLDESEEEIDSLVEGLLKLEANPLDADALSKSFRMLHSLKGSSGLMGFEIVGNLAHELENRFEQFRSGKEVIDRDETTLILHCIDFFREFLARLRTGDPTEGDPSPLLDQLNRLKHRRGSTPSVAVTSTLDADGSKSPGVVTFTGTFSGGIRVRIKFKTGLQLADLKARLILSKLSAIGEVVVCEPAIDDISSFEDLAIFSLTILTDRTIEDVRRIANVDGVESIETEGASLPTAALFSSKPAARTAPVVEPTAAENIWQEPGPSVPVILQTAIVPAASNREPEAPDARGQVGETLRIDIERLDDLMNLTGELVVANSRFSQIIDRMGPQISKQTTFSRSKDLGERLRRRFAAMKHQIGEQQANGEGWNDIFEGLDEELDELSEQTAIWGEGSSHYSQIAEAVDQLTRVSKSLQRGVLKTRMVSVGPLFNRFKRVIRDLSVESGKRVQLTILGEKTELDKRMIDALGDPILHLVRNAIDHGFESPEERDALGKPEIGTIVLEASQRGNNVLITVSDDGRGIDAAKIRERVRSRGLAPESQIAEMTEQQIIDFIWRPGFSTAEAITEISGRGVGMDIVRNSISELSGTIDVTSTAGAGTRFAIRLPLTLAIIHSLLVRFRNDLFSIPIDDVREIVAVPQDQVHAIHRHRTIEVRGEMISLVTMDGIFEWSRAPRGASAASFSEQSGPNGTINVVILHSRGKTLGLSVDALVGRADIVIKSLSENFVPIRGLSGASIMGDGAVCLMLDATVLVDLAAERTLSHTGAARLAPKTPG